MEKGILHVNPRKSPFFVSPPRPHRDSGNFNLFLQSENPVFLQSDFDLVRSSSLKTISCRFLRSSIIDFFEFCFGASINFVAIRTSNFLGIILGFWSCKIILFECSRKWIFEITHLQLFWNLHWRKHQNCFNQILMFVVHHSWICVCLDFSIASIFSICGRCLGQSSSFCEIRFCVLISPFWKIVGLGLWEQLSFHIFCNLIFCNLIHILQFDVFCNLIYNTQVVRHHSAICSDEQGVFFCIPVFSIQVCREHQLSTVKQFVAISWDLERCTYWYSDCCIQMDKCPFGSIFFPPGFLDQSFSGVCILFLSGCGRRKTKFSKHFSSNVQSLLIGCVQCVSHFFDLQRPQVEISDFPKAQIGTMFWFFLSAQEWRNCTVVKYAYGKM